MIYKAIQVNGRLVILRVDPDNGYVTEIIFPDIHPDNYNPDQVLAITITPSMTEEAVKTQIINPLLGTIKPV